MNEPAEDRQSRLQRLLRELEQLGATGLPEREFLTESLRRIVEIVGAPVGVVWRLVGGSLDMSVGFGIDADQAARLRAATAHVQEMLAQSATAGEVRYATPDPTAPAPFDRTTTILAPIVVDEGTIGFLQVFYPGEVDADRRAGLSRAMETCAGHVARGLVESAGAPSSGTADPAALDRFAIDVHNSLVPREVATTAAGDGRLLVGCDRLSVVVRRGRSTRTLATSGVDRVDRRANVVKRMEELCRTVMATCETLRYSGSAGNLAPQVEEPLSAFLEESGTRGVEIVPLVEPVPPRRTSAAEDETARKPIEPLVIGAVVAEWSGERGRGGLPLDRLAAHVSPAMANAVEHDRVFLRPVLRGIGRGFEWFRGRRVWAALGIVAAIAVVAVALAVIPWTYRVEGRGRLMPVVRRDVFAPEEAIVESIEVESGATVEAGDVLVKLRSDPLNERMLELVTELNERNRQISALRGRIAEARDDTEAVARFEAELAETTVRISGLNERIDRLVERMKSLEVRAPVSGTVATFQLRQRLADRPVQRGELLLEVMQPSEGWRLELEVDEKRLGHLTKAIAAANGEPLDVEYVLATEPERSHQGELARLAERVRTSEDGSVLEVQAELVGETLPVTRFGAEVRARIDCGEKSLGYVLFGDVVEFVRRRLWW